jgi:acetyltransferase
LNTALPSAANAFNPVDMLASASPEIYARCLKILLEDENVDGVLIILPPPPMYRAEEVAVKLVETISNREPSSLPLAGSKLPNAPILKPVIVALLGSNNIREAQATLQSSNITTYPFPERVASAFGALVRRAEYLSRGPSIIDDHIVRRPLSMARHSLEEILTVYKIPTAPVRLARSAGEATAIAQEIGYPVVIKIASPDIVHKSDVGGVRVNIQDDVSLLAAYTQILKNIRETRPDARVEGMAIQRQIADGQEVILGAVHDAQFGPLMMFGSGGVEVEGLKDVAFALAPLTRIEALKMIDRTWAGKKLAGFRNIPPVDKDAVVDVLVNLSALVMENPSIDEIEINPLRVLSKGAVAVDVRIKLHDEST